MKQISIFDDMYPKYKNNKPIRLIELFAGIGSQAKALKNINANFEIYKVVEFDSYAIKSYNSIHSTNFETTDITKITANDLNIVNTNEYEYIMTYSFPCQDLSLAGKRKGMKKGDSTRSGLLWEVERLLKSCKELPQILLMENVPQVICSDFNDWQLYLEKLGYKNYTQILNAKDYGIPQNRNRCFMVSILGDYSYSFPQPIKLDKRLKDLLEDNVDEKYYINADYSCRRFYDIEKIAPTIHTMGGGNTEPKILIPSETDITLCLNSKVDGKQPSLQDRIYDSNGISTAITTSFMPSILFPEDTKQGYAEVHDGDGVYINRPHQKRGVVQKGMIQTIKTSADVGVVIKDKVSQKHCIRKLTPKECWRLMGFSDDDFEKASKGNSNSQLYKQAGNSIVVNVLEEIFKMLF